MPLHEYPIPILVNDVKRGKIKVPIFQREFIWSDNQIALLAESIYKEYPTGLIILYQYIDDEGKERFLILDGQQRILSVYMIFGNPVQTPAGMKYTEIWFNPIQNRFKASYRRPGATWIRLSEVLNSRAEELPKLAEKLATETIDQEQGLILSVLNKLWMRFRNYKFAAYVVPSDYKLDDLGEIFDRVNFAGTKVKSADVLYSVIAIRNEEVGRQLRSLRRNLLDMRWDLDLSVLIRSFIAILTDGKIRLANKVLDQAAKLKELLEKTRPEKLTQIIKQLRNSIENAIAFLSADDVLAIKSSDTKLLLSQAPIITLSYILKKKRLMDNDEKRMLAKWLVLAQYHGRYSSAADTRLDEDLRAFNERGLRGLIDELRRSVGAAILPEERDLTGSSRSRDKLLLLYSLLKFRNATDPRDSRYIVNSYFTVHHIFPRSQIGDRAEDIMNVTFVSEGTNKAWYNRLPEAYLPTLSEEMLEKHMIPKDKSLWTISRYDDFLDARRTLVKHAVDQNYREFR